MYIGKITRSTVFIFLFLMLYAPFSMAGICVYNMLDTE